MNQFRLTNFLYSYLKQIEMYFFKNGEQEGKTSPMWGLVPVGGGRMWGKDVGGWTWCKYCVLLNKNGKMRPVETIPGIGGSGDKGEWWKGQIQLWYIVRTFVNVTTYLQNNNKKETMFFGGAFESSQDRTRFGQVTLHLSWTHSLSIYTIETHRKQWRGSSDSGSVWFDKLSPPLRQAHTSPSYLKHSPCKQSVWVGPGARGWQGLRAFEAFLQGLAFLALSGSPSSSLWGLTF
jgi:hypothetical protein